MSDVNGIEISDVLGLSQPLTKLIETVSVGIGKIYEPCHVKRMAKARAEEMRLISSTINDQMQLPMKYEDGHVSIDAADANELVQRAQNRFLFQEMRKQQNIEAVVAGAYQNLETVDHVAETAVDTDWILRFFDSVATIGDGDMQILWGKILAGEVRQPGSFSLRTLETVKNISRKEAECFQKVAPLILSDDDARFVVRDGNFLEKYDVSFDMLMLLGDCGLMDVTGTVCRNYEITRGTKASLLQTEDFVLMSAGKEDRRMLINVHPLTRAGCELFSTLNYRPSIRYFTAVADHIWNEHYRLFSGMKIFDKSQALSKNFDYDTTKPIRKYGGTRF